MAKAGGQIDLTLPGAVNGNPVAAAPATAEASEPSVKQKRLNPMKLEKMQERCRELEAGISELESEIAQQEAALADFRSAEESMRRMEALERSRAELNGRLAEWEQLSAEIEANS